MEKHLIELFFVLLFNTLISEQVSFSSAMDDHDDSSLVDLKELVERTSQWQKVRVLYYENVSGGESTTQYIVSNLDFLNR